MLRSPAKVLAFCLSLGAAAAFDVQADPAIHWRCSLGTDRFFNVHCMEQGRIEPLPPVPPEIASDPAFARALELADRNDPVLRVRSSDAMAGRNAPNGWLIPLYNLPFDRAGVERLLHAVLCRGAVCRISLDTWDI